MDKISEILNSVKERVSNPLIFSFLVSWLVYNWKIPVALIWFDEKQISANGCNSIFEFIEDEWNRNGNFWIPLGVALLYTFLFPIVKNLITAVQTWALKWGDSWNLNISKGGKVSVEKYISLLEIYDIKTQQLDQIINRENLTLENNKDLHKQYILIQQNLEQLRVDNLRLNEEISKKKVDFDYIRYEDRMSFEEEKHKIFDITFLNGLWDFYINYEEKIVNEYIEINDAIVYSIDNIKEAHLVDDSKIPKYMITNFYRNENYIFFILRIHPSFNSKVIFKYICLDLIVNETGDLLGMPGDKWSDLKLTRKIV